MLLNLKLNNVVYSDGKGLYYDVRNALMLLLLKLEVEEKEINKANYVRFIDDIKQLVQNKKKLRNQWLVTMNSDDRREYVRYRGNAVSKVIIETSACDHN